MACYLFNSCYTRIYKGRELTMRVIIVVFATLVLEWQGLVLEDITYWALLMYGFLFDIDGLTLTNK